MCRYSLRFPLSTSSTTSINYCAHGLLIIKFSSEKCNIQVQFCSQLHIVRQHWGAWTVPWWLLLGGISLYPFVLPPPWEASQQPEYSLSPSSTVPSPRSQTVLNPDVQLSFKEWKCSTAICLWMTQDPSLIHNWIITMKSYWMWLDGMFLIPQDFIWA